MRNSNPKSKKNLASPEEPLTKKEFKALVKEGGKGPFKPIDNLVEDLQIQWEKKQKSTAKKNQFKPEDSFTKEEFIALVKEGEKGPFTALGSFEDFKSEILNIWKKNQGK
jgi:Txe/YoeB family toxin of Txe-Axe toxin-antitoxin module